jgi:hypothetical protein
MECHGRISRCHNVWHKGMEHNLPDNSDMAANEAKACGRNW